MSIRGTSGVVAAALILAAGAARAQSIQDGSFEISGPAFPNPPQFWEATSTNFDSPYCNSSCLGPGQTGAARTGAYWAWFGGTSAYEHASLAQTVQVPASAQLRFYLWASSDRATTTDTLRILVDSSVVFSINNQQILPYIAGYALVTVDLSAFAGAAHLIKFDGETLAGTGLTNFFVDDVSLVGSGPACYPNCDSSTTVPFLNVQDFSCFLTKYASGNPYANCDNSTVPPTLNVQDFSCFLVKYATGCSAP
jgi:hypothetical protein